ncbi:MAG: flippase-like domain-containing protein [Nanoarchaeota archaeon]
MEIIFLVLAFFLNVIIDLLISGQYRYLVKFIEKKISYLSALVIVSLSFFLRLILVSKSGSFLGTPIAGKLKEGISLTKGALIIAFENITYTLWQLFILVFILAFNREFIEENIIIAIPLVFLIIVLMIMCLYKYEKILYLIFKIYSFFPVKLKNIIRKTGLKKENIESQFNKLKMLFSNKLFLLNYNLISLLIILISPYSLVFLGKFYSISVNYFDSFSVYWFSFILGRLSGMPIGLGVRDVSTGYLLTNLGISTQISLQIVFLSRVVSFFPFFPIGLGCFIKYGKEKIFSIIYNKNKD